MATNSGFYHVGWPKLWGDCGSMLISGMTAHSPPTADGTIRLERTGPFIPPISLPVRSVIVTDNFRKQMEQSGMFELGFKNVIKHHIARFQWEHWDRTRKIPEIPESGEPEGFVLDRPHDPLAAEEMGQVWQVLFDENAIFKSRWIDDWNRRRKEFRSYETMVNPATWRGQHFFGVEGSGFRFVTQAGRDWLQSHAAGWLLFHPCLEWDPEAPGFD